MSEKINNHASNEESTMETLANGTKVWKDNDGKNHRLDGPACEMSDGTKFWFIHGKLHRTDGPAVEEYNGSKEWWVHGKFIVSLKPKKNK